MNYIIGSNVTLAGPAVATYSHKDSTIILGCDAKQISDIWHTRAPHVRRFSCIKEFYEECAELLITHEYMHHLIERDVGELASALFDNVDEYLEITGALQHDSD